METAIALGLLGTGYYLSNKSNNNRVANNNNEDLKKYNVGVNNVYDSNYSKKINNKEQRLLNEAFARSNHIKKTNIVNPATIKEHLRKNDLKHTKPNDQLIMDTLNHKAIEEDKLIYVDNQTPSDMNEQVVENFFVSPLTGQKMERQGAHNNMVPFFGGSVRQNTDANATASHMEHFTGNHSNYIKKKEITPHFVPQSNVNHVYGTPNMSGSVINRFIPSRFKEGVPLNEPENVGPGLNQGYTTKGSGGFHQADAQIYAMPKNVDELRTANNPKTSYRGVIIHGKNPVVNRGKIGKINKDRPNTYYVNSPARYNVTTGAYVKERGRPSQIIKETRSANTSKSYTGSAVSVGIKEKQQRPLFRESNKKTYETPTTRNMRQTGSNTKDDFGRKSMSVKPTERETTESRTHLNNITTAVKAFTVPLQDVLKTSKKENFIGNERQAGNFGATVPKKQTVYDPNDVARTTIKETNIHDTRSGNMHAPTKLAVYDPNDVARTTIKETNIHDVRTGNMGATNKRGFVKDANDIARTTLKETNIHNIKTGQMASGVHKTPAYDPEDTTRTTIKEMNIHDVRTGNIGTGEKHGFVKDADDIAKTTIKETLDNEETVLNMSTQQPEAMTMYDPSDVPQTTIADTTIDLVRTGNINSRSGEGAGYLVNEVHVPNTNKQFTSDNEYIGQPNGDYNKGGGDGYLTNDVQVPNTQKQFISDNEHVGNAHASEANAPTTYDSAYNSTYSGDREGVAKNRKPTKINTNIPSGMEKINIDVNKLEGDRVNNRDLSSTRVYNSINTLSNCNLTTDKQNYKQDIQMERNKPDILKAFKQNPYTKPLDSFAFP